jgi:hypothetical protein
MLVTRKSAITGISRTLELPITEEQLILWQNGLVAQQAFPQLNADQREFIITGITEEEWNNAFANEI